MVLPRIPEPELMEAVGQAEAYAAADFSATDQAMVDRVLALFGAPATGERLADLGCGPGNITFRLAQRCPGARVLGIDGSAAMLAIAERRAAADAAPASTSRSEHEGPTPAASAHRRPPPPVSRTSVQSTGPEPRHTVAPTDRRSPAGQITFLHLTLPCPTGRLGAWAGACAAVVSNSLLHHLHDPLVLWSTVRQLAAPGAAIFIRDLRRPPSLLDLDALVALHASDAPPVLRRDYRHSLQAAFTVTEVETQLDQAGLSGLRVSAVEDRYLEVWGRLP